MNTVSPPAICKRRFRIENQFNVILCFVVACALMSCGRPDSISVEVNLESDPRIVPNDTTDSERSLALFLDLSLPMGGYLPSDESRDRIGEPPGSEFRIAAQSVAVHLESADPGKDVLWYGVADVVSRLEANPVINRALFSGSQSQLHLAVDSIISAIRTGRLSAAAIMTDLLGTGGPPGAATVGAHLKSKLREDSVAIEVHMVLMGVKGTYRGVFSRSCPAQDASLGCWYSEREREWYRMDEAVRVPFYALLFGRDAQVADDMAHAISRDLADEGMDSVVWERLTRTGRSRGYTMEIDVDVEEKYALSVDEENRTYRCYRNREVRLRHVFPSADAGASSENGNTVARASLDFIPDSVNVDPQSGPFSAVLRDRTLEIDVDCTKIRNDTMDHILGVEIVGRMGILNRLADWDSLSVPDDGGPTHPGGTLQLRGFVDRARFPDFKLNEPKLLVPRNSQTKI